MRLQKIKIEGYRSLKSVVWEPAPLNVLIGANASGKSNFLHALELLPAAADGELEKTILRRGGMAPLMWDGKAEKLYLEADFRLPDGERPRYALALNRLGDTGSYDISVEKVIASSGLCYRGHRVDPVTEGYDLVQPSGTPRAFCGATSSSLLVHPPRPPH